ncbi:activator of HSP90 ATPase [Planctomyces bekefii]|uniref:Activator of HSP90 ATPase n=1 Tax=Planctomyces bekefii TaxID=1653850 RepID=A0A5C6M917_9PLAN|nr:activator of HSP90 ATPase [Planctomyces bekefii]
MDRVKVSIEAMVDAKIEKVWECWNEPKHITKWNFAIDTWCCPRASNDLRVGGRYSARMEAKDGSFGFDFEVTYDVVDKHKKISYTMGDGRQATTTFEQQNGGVWIATVFDAEQQNEVEMQRNGWQSILNNFKKYVESI